MKATFKGTFSAIERLASGVTKLSILSNGKVDKVSVSAQEAHIETVLYLKNMVVSEMKIGKPITITISDEDVDE